MTGVKNVQASRLLRFLPSRLRAQDVALWHEAAKIDVRSDVGYRGLSGTVTNGPNRSFMTRS